MHIIKFYVCVLTTLMTRIFSFCLCESFFFFFFSKLCIFLEWCFSIASFLFCLIQFIFYTSKYIEYEVIEISFICIASIYVCWHLNERKRKVIFILIWKFFFFVCFDNEKYKHFYYLCAYMVPSVYLHTCSHEKGHGIELLSIFLVFHFL